ncbi:MAG: hypothetical protein ACRD2A_03290 [Vicinamibacterales bacterium]
MVDAGIGRLLISSLHQGIGEVAPTRLDFYETWLSPTGMRDGRLGLAPLGAVLSFLYREGPPTTDRIARRAGTHAADWTFADLSAFRRRLIERLPAWLRTRAALSIGRQLVKTTVRQSRVKARLRRSSGQVEIHSALFDQLREPASIPMRSFYAAALQRMFQRCGIDAEVTVAAEEGAHWRLDVVIHGSSRGVPAADAA